MINQRKFWDISISVEYQFLWRCTAGLLLDQRGDGQRRDLQVRRPAAQLRRPRHLYEVRCHWKIPYQRTFQARIFVEQKKMWISHV